MKDINKLKPLLAIHQNPFEIDKLSFLNRIKSEHQFISIQDCLDYLYKIINNESLNPDNILPIFSELEYSIFKINIIDEAICSIIYEIFITISRNNKDLLKYNTDLLEKFNLDLYNVINKDQYSVNTFFRPLFMIIYLLISLCNNYDLEAYKEEIYKYQLSIYYYKTMYLLYKQIKIQDNYTRTMQNFYHGIIFRHENWL